MLKQLNGHFFWKTTHQQTLATLREFGALSAGAAVGQFDEQVDQNCGTNSIQISTGCIN